MSVETESHVVLRDVTPIPIHYVGQSSVVATCNRYVFKVDGGDVIINGTQRTPATTDPTLFDFEPSPKTDISQAQLLDRCSTLASAGRAELERARKSQILGRLMLAPIIAPLAGAAYEVTQYELSNAFGLGATGALFSALYVQNRRLISQCKQGAARSTRELSRIQSVMDYLKQD